MAGEQGGDMRLLVEEIAKALVDEPDQVQVSAGARIEGAIGKMVRAR